MRPISPSICESTIALLQPPYDVFIPIKTGWRPGEGGPKGEILAWWLRSGEKQQPEFDWLEHRPHGVPLIVILPLPSEVLGTRPLLSAIMDLRPTGVLPVGDLSTPERILELVNCGPSNLPATLMSYIEWRQLVLNAEVWREIRMLFEISPEVKSIGAASRRLYASRRTLGRHFATVGIPVPSHWLQFARLFHAAVALQSGRYTVAQVASRYNYPDAFTLSNQMKRLLDCRPSELRYVSGWEWLVEAWFQQEIRNGGFDLQKQRRAFLSDD
jgi:AraC-like DNA-binding protein